MERASRIWPAPPFLLRPPQGTWCGPPHIDWKRVTRWLWNSDRFVHSFFGWCCANVTCNMLAVQLLLFAERVADPLRLPRRRCLSALHLLVSPVSILSSRLGRPQWNGVCSRSCFTHEEPGAVASPGRSNGWLLLGSFLQHPEAAQQRAFGTRSPAGAPAEAARGDGCGIIAASIMPLLASPPRRARGNCGYN